jgi:Ala-tRNA(Pro) deacylase
MVKLVSLLEDRDVEYEIIKHNKIINTALEGAESLGIQLGETAPTLILRTDQGYYSLIISGNYGRVDMDFMRNLLQVQEIRLAKPKEVEEVTGSSIGNVSLINPSIPTIFDRELYRFSHIFGGTGERQTTLKIRPREVEQLNNVVGYIR